MSDPQSMHLSFHPSLTEPANPMGHLWASSPTSCVCNYWYSNTFIFFPICCIFLGIFSGKLKNTSVWTKCMYLLKSFFAIIFYITCVLMSRCWVKNIQLFLEVRHFFWVRRSTSLIVKRDAVEQSCPHFPNGLLTLCLNFTCNRQMHCKLQMFCTYFAYLLMIFLFDYILLDETQ